MARSNKLEILINAKDGASPVLHGVAGAASSLGSIGKAAFVGIGAAAAAAAASITAVGVALTKLAIDAAPLQGIRAAFEGITGGGEEMLRALREQSAHMISDRRLMQSYNQAAQLVGKQFADQLPSAMRYLGKVAAATGQDMDYMLDSLVRGVGRLSPLILDNLGIQVSLEEATARAATMFGKEADELSKAEIQAGMMNVVMAKLARNTKDMPEVTGTATQGLAALRTAFDNAKDTIGTAFLPALQSILTLFAELRPMFEQAVTWVADLVRSWASGFAQLIADAATWGANIVESLASGISGSGAIVRALRNVANTITEWLKPGSAPKLLPDLAEWGAGALDAWLAGWAPDTVAASQLAQNLRANLRPFLEAIDLGRGIDEAALRDVFGLDTPHMRRYLRAYEAVGRAVGELKDARTELQEAEESGDEEAIAAARQRVQMAEREEYSAKRAFNAEERRLEQRISAEAQIARAVTETAKAQSDAAAKAAQLAEEAKQRAIAQAYLQYRLAVARTALAQIPIWEEELAKAEEGSAEWWNIMTRLVELRRAAAKEAGKGVGEGYKEGAKEAAEEASEEVEKIDWAGIGAAIGGAILDGIKRGLGTAATWIADKISEWAQKPETKQAAFDLGDTLADLIVDGIRALLGMEPAVDKTSDALQSHLRQAVFKIASAAWELGTLLADSLLFGLAAEITQPLFGVSAEQLMAAWFGPGIGHVPTAAAARIFDSDELAAEMVRQFQDAADNPNLPPTVREAAQQQADTWLKDYDLVIDKNLGVLTQKEFKALAKDSGAASAAANAGAAHGTEYSENFLEAAWRILKESQLGEWVGSLFKPPDVTAALPKRPAGRGQIPGYADGGIVTRPTLAMIGERGPEAVVPLDRMGNQYNITIPIDARGANAAEVERGVLAGLRAAGIPIAP